MKCEREVLAKSYFLAWHQLIYDKSPADTHFHHHDGLGSIIGMTDGGIIGPVERSYFYDEFGNELGSWGSISNNYLYTGQEYDGSITDYYNYRARLYDKRIGRFISEDPLWVYSTIIPNFKCIFYGLNSPQDLNAYIYCVNSPLNNIDPTGKWKLPGNNNWCGAGWTGGHALPLEDIIEQKLWMAYPTNPSDWCCMIHDFCFFICRRLREQKEYSFIEEQDCLKRCTENLIECWENYGYPP